MADFPFVTTLVPTAAPTVRGINFGIESKIPGARDTVKQVMCNLIEYESRFRGTPAPENLDELIEKWMPVLPEGN